MYWHHDGSGPGWFVIVPILFWITVLVLIGVFCWGWGRDRRPLSARSGRGAQAQYDAPSAAGDPAPFHDRPEETLYRRFANGEIDADELGERLSTLRAMRQE